MCKSLTKNRQRLTLSKEYIRRRKGSKDELLNTNNIDSKKTTSFWGNSSYIQERNVNANINISEKEMIFYKFDRGKMQHLKTRNRFYTSHLRSVRKDSSNVSQEKGNISKQVKDSPQVRQEKGNISQQGKDFL
jgi:hypothetical protein